MNNTNIITVYVAIILLVALVLIIYFSTKRLKIKISQVREGKTENKKISKLINKAKTSGKNKFARYMVFYALVQSILMTLIFGVMDVFLHSKEFDIFRSLYFLISGSIILSLIAIIRANTIWHQSR